MSEELTSRERIICAIEGKPADRIPFSPFLAYFWEHQPPEVQQRGILEFHKEVGADPLWRGTVCPVAQNIPEVTTRTWNEDDLIVTQTTTPVGSIRHGAKVSAAGNTAFLVEHPLKTEDDFKVLLWMEENTKLDLADQAPVNDQLSMDGLSIGMLIPRGKTAFQQMVEHWVGTEELIYALCDFPDTVDTLYHAMVENDIKAVNLAVQSAYDYFITWEDSSTQNYSPTLYDRYIASEIARFCEILGTSEKSYIQHACGHVKALLPSMKRSGVKGVESISPAPTGNVELADAREMLGEDVAVIGGIEPTMFLNLSIRELETYVEQVIADLSGGPLVLANSDSCPPGVAIEKFKLVSRMLR